MATIHATTMAPTKLQLLAGWLPRQPWFVGDGAPDLARVGGFRLDDPAGEVGIECMILTDGGRTTYFVPLAYRGAPLAGAEDGLVGTSEHGVLGTRWIYDAAYDPVAVARLLALVIGEADAQHQDESDTPDPTVGRSWSAVARPVAVHPLQVSHTVPGPTSVAVETDGAAGSLELVRLLSTADAGRATGHVAADWTRPDGTIARGTVAAVR
jgi:hypothetical protein